MVWSIEHWLHTQYACLILYRRASNWWSIRRCLYIHP